MAVSRCFMFMYFLLPYWVSATWRSRAQTSMRADLPSGKLPTTRVRRQISRFQPLNDIVSADASPVLTGKLAVTEFGMFWISIFILIRTPWIMRSTRCWRMAIKALRYSLRLTSLPHGWMRFFISNRPFSGWHLCGRMFLLID